MDRRLRRSNQSQGEPGKEQKPKMGYLQEEDGHAGNGNDTGTSDLSAGSAVDEGNSGVLARDNGSGCGDTGLGGAGHRGGRLGGHAGGGDKRSGLGGLGADRHVRGHGSRGRAGLDLGRGERDLRCLGVGGGGGDRDRGDRGNGRLGRAVLSHISPQSFDPRHCSTYRHRRKAAGDGDGAVLIVGRGSDDLVNRGRSRRGSQHNGRDSEEGSETHLDV